MIRQKSNLEVKVGIFVFIGIIILTIIVFSIGGKHFFKVGYNIKVIFNFANGLEVGAPVRVAGVSVGEVKDILIKDDPETNKTSVEVIAWLEKNVRIQSDSKAYINTLGLLGEKYVEIMPGVEKDSLNENDILIGHDPVSMEKVTEKALAVINKLDSATEYANRILQRVDKGEGTVGKLFTDETLYRQLEEFVQDIKNNPWKLLIKTKEKKEPSKDSKPQDNKGVLFQKK